MKVTKRQLEALIRESVNEQVSNLNEEELEELLGGLKGMFGAAGAGIKKGAQAAGSAVGGAAQRAGSAVTGAAQRAGSAVSGAAQRAGTAVQGAAAGAAGAVKGAYQAGEKQSAFNNVKKSIQNVGATVDKALQAVGSDPTDQSMLQGIKSQAVALAQDLDAALAESSKGRRPRQKKSSK